MEKKYSPIRDLMLTLNYFVLSSGMSLREVARKLEKEGMNLYNVCSVANGKPEQLNMVMKFDSYIDGILRVTGKDEYDLIKRTLENLTNPSAVSYQDDLSIEMRNFLSNPESQKYLEYALKKYKIDKLEEEKARLEKELSSI